MAKTYYYQVILSRNSPEFDQIQEQAFNAGASGIEEFSIDEPKVDSILGERSYSGGDLPASVLNEVDDIIRSENDYVKIFFSNKIDLAHFRNSLEAQVQQLLQIEEKEIEDWNAEWKKHYAPIEIDSELTLVPSWEKDSTVLKGKQKLYIYPGQGFGTGGHETTFLCLVLFKKYMQVGKYHSCLDFGAGSGILGLAFHMYYTQAHIDLYDIDPAALENCIQNIEINDFSQRDFNLLLPKDRKRLFKQYDVVFANILQNVLLSENDYLANSVNEGGLLILSGLLKGQELEVIESYQKNNDHLQLVEVIAKGDWVAVILRG